MEPKSLLPYSQVPAPRLSLWIFCNKISFYGEESLAPRPTPKLEDHPLPAVHDCLFDIFAASLHIGGRSSIRNQRICLAVVTGTCLSQTIWLLFGIYTMLILQYLCNLEPYTLMRYYVFMILEVGRDCFSSVFFISPTGCEHKCKRKWFGSKSNVTVGRKNIT
jgi:hypothetical protein